MLIISCKLLLNLDPCDQVQCNGINAVCEVILEGGNIGKTRCTCPEGMTGDPEESCGMILNDE